MSDHADDRAPEHIAPPRNVDAERAVLGAMLQAPTSIDEVSDIIAGSDYYTPAHELIHDAITALHSAGTRPDVITVTDHLRNHDNLERAGGIVYLHELIQAAPVAASATHYADLIAATATRRRIISAGATITTLGHTPSDNTPDELIATAQDHLAQLVSAHATDDVPPNHVAVFDALDDLEQPPGLSTPWAALTEALAGWKPQALYIAGARPSIGKSVIGLNAALDTARRGHRAVVFSLEMSRTELYHRLLANVGNVDMGRIQHRRLTKDDFTSLGAAATKVSDLPITIDDRGGITLAQIRRRIRTEQAKSPVGLIVIDYLQLIAPPPGTPRDDRRVQVDAISRGLKQLAKDTGCPVLALSQLNRASEARRDKRPTLSDLREAGGQEQDADVVILLHRDLEETPQTLHIGVAKNRHGPLAQLDLDFIGNHSRAQDPQWSPTSALGA